MVLRFWSSFHVYTTAEFTLLQLFAQNRFLKVKGTNSFHGKRSSELRTHVTCHYEISVTCHSTQVNAPRLISKPRYSIYLPLRYERLS